MNPTKKKIQATLSVLFGASLINTNLDDCKGTFIYREKLKKEVEFTEKQFNSILTQTNDPENAKLERFAAMNRIFKVTAEIINEDFGKLEVIEQLLVAYKNGQIKVED
jgi:hypothetical protein